MDYKKRMASRYAEVWAVHKSLRTLDGVGPLTALLCQTWGRLTHMILRCWRFGMRVQALSSLCDARDRWRREAHDLQTASDLLSRRRPFAQGLDLIP